ncbi:ATP synthase A chain [Candidatus Liberibacter americanus str. Sao Paulo]|uniref:ATP synthase subunit a n=2 Tax=Candidatus Liberibacter americanus TaxID=309868 RepID=U6B5D9_9HYPH|nr:F0F1 ATP synthase subunit A [Candidatus Liberibacter americanus]AHA27873.1 ATP synthase A chain [Candidatus Liberibacter americanus str. Sao Paulo]
MGQFVVHKIVPIDIGGTDLSFTNSSLSMLISSMVFIVFSYIAVRNCRVVPTRMQSLIEILYQFVESVLISSAGPRSKGFLSFIFSLFTFQLAANVLGLFPYLFSFTSQIVVTTVFALIVILTVLISGLSVNGLAFFRLFMPSGIPLMVKPLVCFVEVSSFLSRPISLSLRLFANMLAGHIMLKVFAGFISSAAAFGMLGLFFSFLPLFLNVAIIGLEFFVAIMQAYIFMMLTCLYISDIYQDGNH